MLIAFSAKCCSVVAMRYAEKRRSLAPSSWATKTRRLDSGTNARWSTRRCSSGEAFGRLPTRSRALHHSKRRSLHRRSIPSTPLHLSRHERSAARDLQQPPLVPRGHAARRRRPPVDVLRFPPRRLSRVRRSAAPSRPRSRRCSWAALRFRFRRSRRRFIRRLPSFRAIATPRTRADANGRFSQRCRLRQARLSRG